MHDTRADVGGLRIDAERVAAAFPADRVFGLLTRSFVVPHGWIALANRTGGESTVHPPGSLVEAEGVVDVLFARAEPITVEILEEQVPSTDGYPCVACARLVLRLLGEPGDLKSFRRTIVGDADRAEVRTLARYLGWQCRRVMMEFGEKRTAGDLLDGKDREAITALLRERLRPMLFAAGLVFHQPPTVTFESEAYRQARRERESLARHRDARGRIEEAIRRARARQWTHLEPPLQQLETLAAKTPASALGDLIRALPETQRAPVYDALWTLLPCEARTHWVVAVAGSELLCFDPALPDAPGRRVRIDGSPGPLRSARPYRFGRRPMLLVGAAHGAYVVGVDDLKVQSTYAFEPPPGREFRGGVNAVAAWGGHLFGTHSEAGLIAWDTAGQAAFPLAGMTRRARAVRGAQVVGGRLVFTLDENVIVVPVDSLTPTAVHRLTGSIARITAIHAAEGHVFAGNEIGDLWRWPLDGSAEGSCIRRGDGSPIEGLQCVSAGGVPQLVFAERGTPALQAMVVGDAFTCRYETGGPGVRRCAVAGDVFVAIGDLRDRLICWRPDSPREPYAVIPVAAQCGHSVQDVCLVTEE